MTRHRPLPHGFTLVELLMATAIFAIITAGGLMVFMIAQSTWSTSETQVDQQYNLRQALIRMSRELEESGTDSAGTLRLTIYDNTGPGNSDRIRFSVPLCVCGQALDANAEIAFWGAPLTWGANNCSNAYTLNANGKVTICHRPPGNPENANELEVAPAALPAHLAHNDWIGACSPCTAPDTTYVEYAINSDHQLLRRVIGSNGITVYKEEVIAAGITNFQADLDGAQHIVRLTVTLAGQTSMNRPLSLSSQQDVYLRNAR